VSTTTHAFNICLKVSQIPAVAAIMKLKKIIFLAMELAGWMGCQEADLLYGCHPYITSMTNIVVLPSTNCINFNFAFGDYGNDSWA
jgi:hypothetical protein